MRLPHAKRAEVDIRKLRDYCLDPDHSRGKHKARVFLSALGLARSDAEELRKQILEQATTAEAIPEERDPYGSRFTVDIRVEHKGQSAEVRTGWIVKMGEDYPRLTSCYVKG